MKPGNHIIQSPMSYSLCTGCVSCEMLCGLLHDGCIGPQHNRIFLQPGRVKQMVHTILSCQQCDDHPCYEACPKKDEAMCLDPETNIAYINEAACIGCGKCQKACHFTPSRINLVKSKNKEERTAKKCDLCRDKPDGPQCVKWCPAMCLALSDGPIPWEEAEKEGQA